MAYQEETRMDIKEQGYYTAAFDSVDQLAESLSGNQFGIQPADVTPMMMMMMMKKKKKKMMSKKKMVDTEVNGISVQHPDVSTSQVQAGGRFFLEEDKLPCKGTELIYKYEELLGRVLGKLREHNPELAAGRRRVLRPPLVFREGTRKTVCVNFFDLCVSMHRQPEHVQNFLLAELGTSGSLDGHQRLIAKGRYAPKHFESILRRYVNEYVVCNGCKSPDTILSKENRLFFLRCDKCCSGRSVARIKGGFVALVGCRNAGAN